MEGFCSYPQKNVEDVKDVLPMEVSPLINSKMYQKPLIEGF
jgi:hypothetical protein